MTSNKKQFFIYIVLSVLSFFIFLVLYIFNPIYKETNDTKTTRIYLDVATVPSLFQAWDLVQLPNETKKFVGWQRDTNLDKRLKNNKQNITVISFDKYIIPDVSPIVEFHQKFPSEKFIIHVNWRHDFRLLDNILKSIPKENIKEIHMWEDSLYAAHWDKNSPETFKSYRDKNFSKLNIIYHFKDAPKINSIFFFNSEDYLYIKKQIKFSKIKNQSFEELEKQIRKKPELKEKLYSLIGFDYEKYKKEIKHPYAIFSFGVTHNKVFANMQINILNSLIKENSEINWYYKEHPSSMQCYSVEKLLRKNSNIKPIHKHLPIELFFMDDLIPDYIAGYSSSLFLSTPKKTTILGYIKRADDPYLKLMLKKKIISLKEVFNP